MTTVPGSLIWEIIKRNNAFLVKEFGNGNQMVQFSKEPNNLYNVNSFKHSGLANAKTVSVQDGKDSGIVLATTKTNSSNCNAYPRLGNCNIFRCRIFCHEFERSLKSFAMNFKKMGKKI
ncbi:hypothetical protein MKX03_032777 [Papaver bracteatum]|nr:hypothetical protein MKX03_032777 [Papaver bracteatum]